MREYLLSTIQKTFEVGMDQAECLYQELLQCTRNKNLVRMHTIYVLHFDILRDHAHTCGGKHIFRTPIQLFFSSFLFPYSNEVKWTHYLVLHI